MPSDPYAHVLPQVMATIRAASALAAKDIKFHGSIDSQLAQDFESSGRQLVGLANKLLAKSNPESHDSETLEYGELSASSEGSWKKVSDALDVFFEKADLAMDEMKRPEKSSEYLSLNDASDAGLNAVVSEKPQVHFKVPVDNSETHPFVPKLTEKPHAVKPLHECLALVESEDAPAHYPQPYEQEIMTSPYPASATEKTDEIPSKDWKSTSATWVETPEALAAMINDLKTASEIAVDLEHHDLRTYYGITCLMQISDRNNDWVIDTLALRDALQPLNEIFANPHIVKVFHGANMDIIWLQRDLGLYVVSLFDTYFASKALGFPKFSLAYLLETFAKFKTSKKYQLADWRIRPLPEVMMDYARADTHFLLSIYDRLRNKLLEAGPSKLTEVHESSRKVAAKRYEYVKFRPPTAFNSGMFHNDSISADSFITSYNIPSSRHNMVRDLFQWRDSLARDLDESPRYIMPNRVIVSLCSLNAPVTAQSVSSCFASFSKILRENIEPLTQLVQKSFDENTDSEDILQSKSVSSGDFQATPESVAELAELFSFLEEQTHLLSDDQESKKSKPSDSINTKSKVFQNILKDTSFSVRVPQDGSKPKVVNISALKERLDLLSDITYTPLNPSQAALTETSQDPASQEKITSNDPEPAGNEEIEGNNESVGAQDAAKPSEELITLSRSKIRKPSNKTKTKHEEPAFDYSAVDTKMLAKDESQIRKKKRSYEPFSKQDNEGPQPFKGRKVATQGKTTSFIKKKK